MKWLLLPLLFSLSGCGSQLRKPFCSQPTTSFPAEFQGTYAIVVPSISTAWSGAMVLQDIRFSIDEKSVASSALFPTAWSQMCEVQGRIFSEQRNANGTYALSEITRFDDGLVYSSLSVDLKAAQDKHFSLQYVPSVDHAVGDTDETKSFASFENFSGGVYILDNTSLNANQVLSVMKAVSFQVVLRKTPDLKKFAVKARASFDRKGVLTARP